MGFSTEKKLEEEDEVASPNEKTDAKLLDLNMRQESDIHSMKSSIREE